MGSFDVKIDKKGRICLLKEVRADLQSTDLKAVPVYGAVLLHPKDADPNEVLRSVDVLQLKIAQLAGREKDFKILDIENTLDDIKEGLTEGLKEVAKKLDELKSLGEKT